MTTPKEDIVKQVIVMRKDLQMRKGKMIAQGAHASMKVILDLMGITGWFGEHVKPGEGYITRSVTLDTLDPVNLWLNGLFTKVAVSVGSEEELLEIKKKADEAGVLTALITDAGATEFHGVPTNTCIAVGPDRSSKIDPITGHLKLL